MQKVSKQKDSIIDTPRVTNNKDLLYSAGEIIVALALGIPLLKYEIRPTSYAKGAFIVFQYKSYDEAVKYSAIIKQGGDAGKYFYKTYVKPSHLNLAPRQRKETSLLYKIYSTLIQTDNTVENFEKALMLITMNQEAFFLLHSYMQQHDKIETLHSITDIFTKL